MDSRPLFLGTATMVMQPSGLEHINHPVRMAAEAVRIRRGASSPARALQSGTPTQTRIGRALDATSANRPLLVARAAVNRHSSTVLKAQGHTPSSIINTKIRNQNQAIKIFPNLMPVVSWMSSSPSPINIQKETPRSSPFRTPANPSTHQLEGLRASNSPPPRTRKSS